MSEETRTRIAAALYDRDRHETGPPWSALDARAQQPHQWRADTVYTQFVEPLEQRAAVLEAMFERMENPHVVFHGPDGKELHRDWCRECRVDAIRGEADALRQMVAAAALELRQLAGRYTVCPDNALRVIGLLGGDVARIAEKLRAAADQGGGQ